MIGDLENVVFWTLGLGVLGLWLWAKYRASYSSGWSSEKAKAFSLSALFLAIGAMSAFDIASEYISPSAVVGTISHIRIDNPGKSDHSNFDVQPVVGNVVRISSGRNFVVLLREGEPVEVTYNRWTSFPYRIDALLTGERRTVLQNDRHEAWNWLFLTASVLGLLSFTRKFRSADEDS